MITLERSSEPVSPESGADLSEEKDFEAFVGTSAPMKELYALLRRVGPTTAPVLIVGESGTGKELAARTLHDLSPRASAPFVAVNCGAIPETLFESELFGHEKGAFTGASDRRPGYFEIADGGTLFLDELDAMPIACQVKMLRALEQKTFRRVRGKDEVHVDVRIVAAIGSTPQRALERGLLREDLFYRINVFSVRLPPLRERGDDAVRLAKHFLSSYAAANGRSRPTLSSEAERAIRAHLWPGNVRELRNAMERAVILTQGAVVGIEALPPSLRGQPHARCDDEPARPETTASPGAALESAVGMSLDEATRRLTLATLESMDFNKTQTAKVLGVSVKTIYNKLKDWSGEGDLRAERAQRLSARQRGAVSASPATRGAVVSLAEARQRKTG